MSDTATISELQYATQLSLDSGFDKVQCDAKIMLDVLRLARKRLEVDAINTRAEDDLAGTLFRTQQVESWGKHVLEIRAGDSWKPLHTDYYAVLDKMRATLAAALAAHVAAVEADLDRLKAWLVAHESLWPATSGSPIDIALLVLHSLTAKLTAAERRLGELEGK